MGMPQRTFTVRSKKFLNNKLLSRTQFAIEVLHPDASSPSKKEIEDSIVQMYHVRDVRQVVVWGIRTVFGGGKSLGLALIYDSLDGARRFEPHYRLVRLGLLKKGNQSRKQIKEKKNRAKKTRGNPKKLK